MNGWQSLKIGDITKNFDSKRVPIRERDRVSGKYPYYGASGIVDYVHEYIFDGNFILVAEDGENLRSRKTPIAFPASGKFWVNNHAHIVQGNELSDTRFIGYLIEATDISGFLTGSTIPKLNQQNLNDIPVMVPPLADQKAIAHILGTLDDKIELNQKMNQTLEEIAKAIFKSWFVDFDPVRAKAEGRSIGLSKEISDLFPDSFEDSELGEIPRGWKVGNLGNLCAPKRGKVITKAKVEPGNIPVVAGGIKPPYYHSESNAESPIVTISASGTAGFVNLYYQDIWASDCSYINKEITDNVFFIYSFLKINQQRIYDLRHGAVQQHVYPKDLIELPIFLSSISLVEEYEKIATSFHEKISLNIEESKNLEAIRDTLLPRLISGELQISDAENLVKKAGI